MGPRWYQDICYNSPFYWTTASFLFCHILTGFFKWHPQNASRSLQLLPQFHWYKHIHLILAFWNGICNFKRFVFWIVRYRLRNVTICLRRKICSCSFRLFHLHFIVHSRLLLRKTKLQFLSKCKQKGEKRLSFYQIKDTILPRFVRSKLTCVTDLFGFFFLIPFFYFFIC
jgi:hypothetical protein